MPDKPAVKVVTRCVDSHHSWTTGGLGESKWEELLFLLQHWIWCEHIHGVSGLLQSVNQLILIHFTSIASHLDNIQLAQLCHSLCKPVAHIQIFFKMNISPFLYIFTWT